MTKQSISQKGRVNPATHRMRLPGFVVAEEIGLGDLVKRVTHSAGIHPCGGCNHRAAALNRWMRFTR